MATVKTTIMFGTYQENGNKHAYRFYRSDSGNFIITDSEDKYDAESVFIEIPIEDWLDIVLFAQDELDKY